MAKSLDPTDTPQKAVFAVGLMDDWRNIPITLIDLGTGVLSVNAVNDSHLT
jgi:hypothetical protein